MLYPFELDLESPTLVQTIVGIYDPIFALIPIRGPLQKWQVVYTWRITLEFADLDVFHAPIEWLETAVSFTLFPERI